MLHNSVLSAAVGTLSRLVVAICVLGAIVSTSSGRPGQTSYAAHVGEVPPSVTTAYSTRNLSQYDCLPPIERTIEHPSTSTGSGDETRTQLLLVKQFVWEHWRDRRRGHVRVKLNFDQGRVVEWHVFVEPATNGEWRLIKISTYSGNGSRPMAITCETRRVVRVLASTWKAVPRTSKVNVEGYQLAYINADGKAASLDFY